MLVLSRKVGDSLWIGDDIQIFINKIEGRQVSLAISAPKKVKIIRDELVNRSAEEENPCHQI